MSIPLTRRGMFGRRVLLCLLCLMPTVGAANVTGMPSWFQVEGYVKNETAYRYYEPRAFTKMRNTVAVNTRLFLGSHLELTAKGWAYNDAIYSMFDYDTISARSERDSLQPLNFIESLSEEQDNNISEWRELYLDMFLGNMDVRLGKQLIVWGVMTGVRIVDEVNPMDFRELIFPDLLDYRVPLWSAKMDYYFSFATLEMIWIPDIQFHKPAPAGSEWEMLQEVPGTVYPDSYSEETLEYGGKLSFTTLGTELALSYFYTWDDFPVVFRQVAIDNPDIIPQFFPTFSRITMYGLTFQRPVNTMVIKGEFAYVKDKYFGLSVVDRDLDGIIDSYGEKKVDHVRWGVGLDINIWKTDYSLGITQWVIPQYDPALIQPQVDSSYNIFIRKELPAKKAVFQTLAVILQSLNEVYLKPKITFSLTDQFLFSVGLDLMFGEGSQIGVAARDGKAVDLIEMEQRYQFIGNFNRNDRLFLEFKYNF